MWTRTLYTQPFSAPWQQITPWPLNARQPCHCPRVLFGPNHFSMTTSLCFLAANPSFAFVPSHFIACICWSWCCWCWTVSQSRKRWRHTLWVTIFDTLCQSRREMEWKFFMDRSVVEDISATFSQCRLRDDRRALAYPAMHMRVWTERKVG